MKQKVRCWATGNVRYADEIAARLALATVQRIGPSRGHTDLEGYYFCRRCHGHHLSPVSSNQARHSA